MPPSLLGSSNPPIATSTTVTRTPSSGSINPTTPSNTTSTFITLETATSDPTSYQPSHILPSKAHIPWPSNLILLVIQITNSTSPPPMPPDFSFELTREAAQKNFCILLQHKGDLGSAIHHQRHSPVGYGSEFRPINHLEPLLYLHPYWPKFKSLLTNGSSWPLQELSEDERKRDVEEALEFGNHKQEEMNPDLLTSLIVDDVTHGFALPLPLEKISRIRGVLIAPLNIASQDTIDEQGNSIPKKRLTHNQSYIFQG